MQFRSGQHFTSKSQAISYLPYLYMGPVILLVCVSLIYKEGGVACLPVVAVITLMPVQILFGKLVGKWRVELASFTDKRVRVMNEIIDGMRVIKMYCWEKLFSSLIKKIRRKEMAGIMRTVNLKNQNVGLLYPATKLTIYLIAVIIMTTETEINTQKVVRIIGWLNMTKYTLSVGLPVCIQSLYEMKASVQRIQNFLNSIDHTSGVLAIEDDNFLKNAKSSVVFKNLSANWEKSAEEGFDNNTYKPFALCNINASIQKGQLVIIVGDVGSGKTSMLMAILNEMNVYHGGVDVRGSIGYVPQEAWVISASVRENVVMGCDFDSDQYQRAIECSALDMDISKFTDGDGTLVGERGITLSGGQKARLNLARAIYFDTDIYLMDDPLSAVDANVAKQIIGRCICGILHSKTRIMVTHHLSYLDKADQIFIMKDGCIIAEGDHITLRNELGELSRNSKKTESDDCVENNSNFIAFHRRKSDGILTVDNTKWMTTQCDGEEIEDRKTGNVNPGTYADYLFGGIGKLLFPGFLLALSFMVAGYCYADVWFINWVQDHNSYNKTKSFHSERNYIIKYGIFIVLTMIFAFMHAVLYSCSFVLSAKRLHNKMFDALLRLPVSFFDTNASGRILNRFAKDTEFMDTHLPVQILIMSVDTFIALGIWTFNFVINPFVIIIAVPLVILLFIFRQMTVRTLRDLKRIEALRHSPLYTHLIATFQGITSIRALRIQQKFTDKFDDYLNSQTCAWFTLTAAVRWVANTVDVILWVAVACCTIAGIIFSKLDINGGVFGVAISLLLDSYTMIGYVVRQSAELECKMTSVERIKQYGELESEAAEHTEYHIPENWPSRGSIVFDHISLSYNTCHLPVLKDINITIHSKEKVGIVGRTGAGKSSLMTALLRLVEPEGRILIDGVDITKIGLTDLRESIAIIPQDPVLFGGSLRQNLDPFQKYTDDQIWQSLNEVQLKEKIGADGLNIEIGESGGNFSVGQKQLVCLARAILRNNKILVIDEATANVDQRTDGVIQNAIRSRFKDSTVLCIAHRIQTVIDMDRILVLDGAVRQFDSPQALIEDVNGMFFKIIQRLSNKEIQELMYLIQHRLKNNSLC